MMLHVKRKPKGVNIRVEPKDLEIIKKAAKAERRSMAQFFVLSALGAAKAKESEGVAAS